MCEKCSFSWSNPICYEEAGTVPLRDPFILKVGELWYMTGSLPPYAAAGERPGRAGAQRSKGVPLYKSADLRHWSFVDMIVPSPPDDSVWYYERFWAPEIFAHNGKYYVTVNCTQGVEGDLGCLLAAADDIEGPYTVLTPDAPLVRGNDAHLFADENGQVWLFETGVWCAKVDLDAPRLLTEKKYIVQPVSGSDAWNGSREGVGFEGPFVLHRDGVYWLFYSGWARGYEVGLATARSVEGPWNMLPQPVYGAQDPSWCRLWNAAYQPGFYAAEGVLGQAGHNCVFEGPDGEWWIAAHAYAVTEDPFGNIFDVKLVMDRLTFDGARGVLALDVRTGAAVNGPTCGEQTLRYDPAQTARNNAPVRALPVRIRTVCGTACRLPAQVDVLLKNGFRAFAPVVWGAAPAAPPCGEYTVRGTAQYRGESFPVTACVTVLPDENK